MDRVDFSVGVNLAPIDADTRDRSIISFDLFAFLTSFTPMLQVQVAPYCEYARCGAAAP
jgi:hypothetical protein